MMARYGVPATRLRWYNTQTQRAPGVTALAAKSLMVPLGMIVDAFRIGTWVRRQDVVMVPGMGVIETSLPLRSWHTPYSMFLVSVFGRLFGTKIALVGVGANDILQPLTRPLVTAAARLAYYRSFRDTLKLAKPTLSVGYSAKFGVLMEEVGLAEFCQSAHSVDVDRLIEQFTELESRSTQPTTNDHEEYRGECTTSQPPIRYAVRLALPVSRTGGCCGRTRAYSHRSFLRRSFYEQPGRRRRLRFWGQHR